MKILLLFLVASLALAKDNPKYDTLFRKTPPKKLQQQIHWFDQVRDHYDYDSKNLQLWKQRYWTITDYFNPKSGPVFLFICGEWVCNGVPDSRSWLVVLAQRLQGLVLTLEHRFYGESLPFGQNSFKIENMAFLNSEQALRDLSHFIEVMKGQKRFGISNNPWICVGGSYPGALSAWFRYKYPHLVIGAIASSAVVNAIEDFQDFDEQIYLSSSLSTPQCSYSLNISTSAVEKVLTQSEEKAVRFKSQFLGGEKLSNKEFMFFWADSIVLTIQYGGRTQLCLEIEGKSDMEILNVLIENAKNYQVCEYGSFYLKNETLTYETQSPARPWYYQYCTEYGWFQTYSQKHPMRSFWLTLDFFQEFCSDAFGPGTWPNVQRKNIEYGALEAKSSKILFSNGVEDPWKWASLQSTDSPYLIARVADCENCAHCVDLNTPDPSDPQSLKKIRDEQYLTLQEWIDDYWRETTKEVFESILKSQI